MVLKHLVCNSIKLQRAHPVFSYLGLAGGILWFW